MTIQTFTTKSLHYTQARRHDRVPANFPVRVVAEDLRLEDRALNVSEGGMCVETTSPLAVMSLLTLRLQLASNESLEVLGRVMWMTKQAMGVRFERVDPRLFDSVERLRRGLTRL